jgi:Flp pilus assembly protein TadG
MRTRRRGFVLIAMSVAMLLMLGMIGMAFDLGRVYIARNEAQVFTDAAAMTAAAALDGTPESLERARSAVARLPIRWNLGTESFTGVQVEFSDDGQRWSPSPGEASTVEFARVTAPDTQVEILFLRAVGAPESLTVPAHSVARTRPVRLVGP